MYPTMEATHISILAKFHILNTVAVSGVIVIAALIRKLSFKILKNFITTKEIYTGCLLISVACLGINNLVIFWSLRAEILKT